MKKTGIATLVLASAVLWVTNASAIGAGVGVMLPTGDLGDHFDAGYGAHVVLDYPVTPLASVYGTAGWQNFAAKSTTETDALGITPEDLSLINASVGGKAGLGTMYLGLELGYYFVADGTGDDEFGVVPLVGMGLGPLDASVRYKVADELKWFEVRAGIGF